MADLTRKVVRGAAWNMGGTAARESIRFAAMVVVANILDPSDYAVAGLALMVLGLFNELSGQGFAQALIQRADLEERTTQSVFWFMCAAGLFLGGIVALSSPLAADFYEQPALVPVLMVLAAGLAVGMVGAVPNALLQRAMRFREINIVATAGAVVSAGLGIGLAVGGLGYWALIAPVAGVLLLRSTGAFLYAGFRPRRLFSSTALRTVAAFGIVLMLSGILRFLSDNLDYAIMSKYWSAKVEGTTLFGLYYFAFELAQKPFLLLMTQLRSVLFPALSVLQDDLARLRTMFLKATHAAALLLMPLHVLMIGLADPLVPWIFDPKWAPAVPVFQTFAAFGFLRAVASFVPSALLAINRPRVTLYFSTFRISVLLPTLIILGSRGAGIATTATVLVVIWHLQAPIYIAYTMRAIGLSVAELWKWLRGPIVGSVAMAVPVALARYAVSVIGGPTWLGLAIAGVSGTLVFLLLEKEDLRRTIKAIR